MIAFREEAGLTHCCLAVKEQIQCRGSFHTADYVCDMKPGLLEGGTSMLRACHRRNWQRKEDSQACQRARRSDGGRS